MTPEEYLLARGWGEEVNYKPNGDSVSRWFDANGDHASTEIAVAIQVRCDHDCAEFARAYGGALAAAEFDETMTNND